MQYMLTISNRSQIRIPSKCIEMCRVRIKHAPWLDTLKGCKYYAVDDSLLCQGCFKYHDSDFICPNFKSSIIKWGAD